jgi:hypothetical protein
MAKAKAAPKKAAPKKAAVVEVAPNQAVVEALDMLAGLTPANSSEGGVVFTLQPANRTDLMALLESLK